MSVRPDHLIERAAARLHTPAPPSREQQPIVEPPRNVPAAPADIPRPHAHMAVGQSVAPAPAGLPALPDQPPELALPQLERAGLVVGRSTRTRISEEFRVAVGRIARAAEHANAGVARNPLMLVTSAKPGEGKSFSAINLACVLAQNGPRRVVLVDIDLKRESLSFLLGLEGRRGVYDLLTPEISDPRSLLVTTEVPRLSVIPAGAVPAEDLGSSFTRPLGPRIVALAHAFPDDIVVMDAPPCLSTSDPSTLAELAGQVVLVVEAGRTQRAEVEAALEFVRSCSLVTMLLNKVRQTNRQTFGSYDYVSSYQ